MTNDHTESSDVDDASSGYKPFCSQSFIIGDNNMEVTNNEVVSKDKVTQLFLTHVQGNDSTHI